MPLIIVLIVIGAAFSLGGYAVYRIVIEVPQEDRTYLDRPPTGFRLIWWPVQLISYNLGPLLPLSFRQKLQVRLRKGGVDYILSPEQFIAGQIISGLVSGAIAAMFLNVGESTGLWLAITGLGIAYPSIWLNERIKSRRHSMLKELPFYIDVITLAVEAGLNLTGAINQAILKGQPTPLHMEFTRLMRETRAGKTRVEALRNMADRISLPQIGSLVSTLIQAETMGVSLGPVLRSQADQRRIERFQRAEKLAMEAPVKMLGPLVLFIFPNTFIILAFPIVVKFMSGAM